MKMYDSILNCLYGASSTKKFMDLYESVKSGQVRNLIVVDN